MGSAPGRPARLQVNATARSAGARRGRRRDGKLTLAVVSGILLSVGGFTAASAAGVNPTAPAARAYLEQHGFAVPASAPNSGGAETPPATPRARCAPGDLVETDRQGRVPERDYASGRAGMGYTCNLRVVGATGGVGGFQVHRYVDRMGHECAFYDSTFLYPSDAYRQDAGTYVLDMSDPARPVRTAELATPAMSSPHESMRLNAERGLLVAAAGSGAVRELWLDVYDVGQDCRQPVLRSSTVFPGLGHEGGMSPDGRTYWSTTSVAGGITAFDLTDPSAPRVVWSSKTWTVHGLSVSADGNRVYLADGTDSGLVGAALRGGTGLRILDVTEVQRRDLDPQVHEISFLTWPVAAIAQNSVPVTIKGRAYLVQFDEFDQNSFSYSSEEAVGAARIIDIHDEQRPRVVSDLRLEVHQPSARASDQKNNPGAQGFARGYAAHYCAVPRPVDPEIVACTMIGSGLRIFDIRDPERPREVAYHIQPQTAGTDPSERGAYAMSGPAFAPERREVWYTDIDTGFFNVQLSKVAWPQSINRSQEER